MINDFRGISPENNVRFRTQAHPTKGIWVDIVATRAIARGEEILSDYDYGMPEDDGNGGGGGRRGGAGQARKKRPQPPNASAEQFEAASLRTGEDGCSQWQVVGSYVGAKEAASSRKRRRGNFRKQWVLVRDVDNKGQQMGGEEGEDK